MKAFSLVLLNLIFIIILYFSDGKSNCTTKVRIPNEDLDLSIDPRAFKKCVKRHSNIVDVKKFPVSPFLVLPEHVYCAYKCMAEKCGLLTDSGFLDPHRMKNFPAIKRNFTWREKSSRITKECFKSFVDYRVETCLDFQGPMICFDPSALIGY